MTSANLFIPDKSTLRQGTTMDKSVRTPTEERISLLEHRVAMLEARNNPSKISDTENVLSLLGLSVLLKQIHEKIQSNPKFSDYDDYLRGIFDVDITDQNRPEYSEKVCQLSLTLMDDAINNFNKRKK